MPNLTLITIVAKVLANLPENVIIFILYILIVNFIDPSTKYRVQTANEII